MAGSNFKDTKIAIDTLFKDNWTDTPIHYSGVSFDSTNIPQWINVIYDPLSGGNTGVGGSSTISKGLVHVVCWAEFEFEANEVADDVVAMFFSNLPSTISSIDYEISDQGYNDNSKAYMMLTFPIKSFITVC